MVRDAIVEWLGRGLQEGLHELSVALVEAKKAVAIAIASKVATTDLERFKERLRAVNQRIDRLKLHQGRLERSAALTRAEAMLVNLEAATAELLVICDSDRTSGSVRT